jgi:hypothetical protein
MSEQTHFHICSFTDFGDLRIEAAGKSYRFEFSHRFGPAMLDKRGEVKDSMPRQRDPFWKALQLWCQQGHTVEDGRAVYALPPVERALRLSPRTLLHLAADVDPQAALVDAYRMAGMEMPPNAVPDVVITDEYTVLRGALNR